MPRRSHSPYSVASLLSVKPEDVEIVLFDPLGAPTYPAVDSIPAPPHAASRADRRDRRSSRHASHIDDTSRVIHKRTRVPPVIPSTLLSKDVEMAVTEDVLAYCARRLERYEAGSSAKRPPRPQRNKSAQRSKERGSKLRLRIRLNGVEPDADSKRERPPEPTPSSSRAARRKSTSVSRSERRNEHSIEAYEVYIPKHPAVKRDERRKQADHMLYMPQKSSKDSGSTEKKRPRSSRSPSIARSNDAPVPLPTTPLEHILYFARGHCTALGKVEKHEKSDVLKKRTSLATFSGCGEFHSVCLADYVRELAVAHTQVVKGITDEGPGSEKLKSGLNGLESNVTDRALAEAMSANSSGVSTRQHEEGHFPPALHLSLDLVQLASRLWQRMLWIEHGVMVGFVNMWYESKAALAVAKLAMGVLALWEHCGTASRPPEEHRCEIVEWCVRQLASMLCFELSPVSLIDDCDSVTCSSLLIQSLGKDGLKSLPGLIDSILNYVDRDASHVSRECRQGASDLCQAFLTRRRCPFEAASAQKTVWDGMIPEIDEYAGRLMKHATFWPLTVHSAIQVSRKEERSSDVIGAIAFLTTLLSESAPSRSLLTSQAKHREGLLQVLCKLLDRLSRKPLPYFYEIEKNQKRYPNLPSSVDLVRRLMSFAVVQRELISSHVSGQKDNYLAAIESIISNIAREVDVDFGQSTLVKYAGEGKFGLDLREFKESPKDFNTRKKYSSASEDDDEDTARGHVISRHRALAFGAWLIGSLGKSMEDGSRDMSQMNGLSVLMLSRFKSNRALMRLWTDVFKIQVAVERHLPVDLCQDIPDESKRLLTDTDRNHFSMVAFALQSRVRNEGKEKSARATPESSSKVSSPEDEALHLPQKSGMMFSFPKVRSVSQLRGAISSGHGYWDLDDDPILMKVLEKASRQRGVEALARYDKAGEFATTSWIRLQKKNVYLPGARELLERADKILGNPCSCLPGNPPEHTKDSQSRIACSNDLCENRSAKVECVPGECGGGSYCRNQRMQRLEYAKVKVKELPGKGAGVIADEDIPAGALIGEYQGEILSTEMFEERRKEYDGERHFYFMTLTSKLVIDASRKSQLTRFVNHSCEPNAEAQKWNAGGEPRVGIFASRDISKLEEVTFDYGARSLASEPEACLCGAKSCRGFLTSVKAVGDDCDEIEPDISGLANTEEMTLNSAAAGKQISTQAETLEALKKKSEDKEKMVEEKIRRGRVDLNYATELKTRRLKLPDSRFDESSLDEHGKERLKKWEESLLRKGKPPAASGKSLEKVQVTKASSVPAVRIPRRALAKPGQEPRPASAGLSILKRFLPGNNAKKTIPRRSPPRRPPQKAKAPEDVYRSATSSAFKMPDSRVSLALYTRKDPPDQHRRDMRHGDSGLERDVNRKTPDRVFPRKPRQAFLPTSSKNKKPRPAPKFASRPRTKREGSDDDSMDDFSIASDAEPIVDEPLLSPSNLPDGNGACSDDEFVAAPPVSSIAQKTVEPEALPAASQPVPNTSPRQRETRPAGHDPPHRQPRDEPAYMEYDGRHRERTRSSNYGNLVAEAFHDRAMNGHIGESSNRGYNPGLARAEERPRRDERGGIQFRDPGYPHDARREGHGRRDGYTTRDAYDAGEGVGARDTARYREPPPKFDGGSYRGSYAPPESVPHGMHRPRPGQREGFDRRERFDQREAPTPSHRGMPRSRDGVPRRDADNTYSRGTPGQWHGAYRGRGGGYRDSAGQSVGHERNSHGNRDSLIQRDVHGFREVGRGPGGGRISEGHRRHDAPHNSMNHDVANHRDTENRRLFHPTSRDSMGQRRPISSRDHAASRSLRPQDGYRYVAPTTEERLRHSPERKVSDERGSSAVMHFQSDHRVLSAPGGPPEMGEQGEGVGQAPLPSSANIAISELGDLTRKGEGSKPEASHRDPVPKKPDPVRSSTPRKATPPNSGPSEPKAVEGQAAGEKSQDLSRGLSQDKRPSDENLPTRKAADVLPAADTAVGSGRVETETEASNPEKANSSSLPEKASTTPTGRETKDARQEVSRAAGSSPRKRKSDPGAMHEDKAPKKYKVRGTGNWKEKHQSLDGAHAIESGQQSKAIPKNRENESHRHTSRELDGDEREDRRKDRSRAATEDERRQSNTRISADDDQRQPRAGDLGRGRGGLRRGDVRSLTGGSGKRKRFVDAGPRHEEARNLLRPSEVESDSKRQRTAPDRNERGDTRGQSQGQVTRSPHRRSSETRPGQNIMQRIGSRTRSVGKDGLELKRSSSGGSRPEPVAGVLEQHGSGVSRPPHSGPGPKGQESNGTRAAVATGTEVKKGGSEGSRPAQGSVADARNSISGVSHGLHMEGTHLRKSNSFGSRPQMGGGEVRRSSSGGARGHARNSDERKHKGMNGSGHGKREQPQDLRVLLGKGGRRRQQR